jgi:hypothetical protein
VYVLGLSKDCESKLLGLASNVDAVLSICEMEDCAECDGPPALLASFMRPFLSKPELRTCGLRSRLRQFATGRPSNSVSDYHLDMLVSRSDVAATRLLLCGMTEQKETHHVCILICERIIYRLSDR